MNVTAPVKVPRRQQILEALARELELNPGTPITTANLAKSVGVSEAALYRHFPSKAKMFEGLIEFAEDTIFSLINRIQTEEKTAATRCEKLVQLLLGFSDRNPGIARILTGNALVGENERLHVRIGQFYERLETQIKQFLREGIAHNELNQNSQVNAVANLILSFAEGRMNQFVRSGFKRRPTESWDAQWQLLASGIFSA